MSSAHDLMTELDSYGNPIRAAHSQGFFKTGVGQYGEGDVFLGLTVPQTRLAAKKYRDLDVDELRTVLASPFHEHRLAALIIMSDTFKKRSTAEQQALYDLYLEGLESNWINNWDLVDTSAQHIVGAHLQQSPEDLYKMALSENLWIRRTSILATFAFLKKGDASHTIRLAEILLHDTHDLMHKAVGWLLREAGKQVGESVLTDFLDRYHKEMPRTMLRYAIERLTPEQRAKYMRR
jgi:3-methyladenine DNA glycosylase AlkD